MGNGSGPAALVAKTDRSFLSSVEWQSGHSGTVSARTSVSNSFPQPWQAYSYIGMAFSSSNPDFARGGIAKGFRPLSRIIFRADANEYARKAIESFKTDAG